MNDRRRERPLRAILGASRERVVRRHPVATGQRAPGAKSASKFYAGGKLVGEMFWEADGNPYSGWTLRDCKKHGLSLEWWPNGVLSFSEPHVDGLMHGRVRHWDDEGELLLETRWVMGTGVDLWCDLHSRALAEETLFRRGARHGHQRHWNADGRSVWSEEHYVDGLEHGISRQWNGEGRLRRGFPRYFVRGERVARRAYLSAASVDETLPPWRPADDRQERSLPLEVVGQPIHRELLRRRRHRYD